MRGSEYLIPIEITEEKKKKRKSCKNKREVKVIE